jgi:tetratricopeptide (TPR) repeat protein
MKLCRFVVPSLLTATLAACQAALPPPKNLAVSQQIVTQDRDTTAPDLFAQAERELLDGRYADARRDFELLLKADPASSLLPKILFDLGTADEGLGDKAAAQVAYHTLADKFPELPTARTALVRCVSIHALFEDWTALGETGDALLKRTDLDNLDKIEAFGARALARGETGDIKLAMKDIYAGIDIMDDVGLGRTGKLPTSGALLKLAQGETRRVETERIALQPVGDDFVMKVSARCQGLLDAQSAYAEAMRTTDPQWAMMAGYRLGAMYEKLHRELMAIPPDGFAKNERQRQIFYGIMHVRYRALLDKAIIMLKTTLEVADRVNDKSTWVDRGREQKASLEASLAEEKAMLAKFPFTEEELEKALKIMQEKAEKH